MIKHQGTISEYIINKYKKIMCQNNKYSNKTPTIYSHCL